MKNDSCSLCNALSSQAIIDIPLWSTPGYVILRTLKRKGHSKRCMIVSTSHGDTGAWDENSATVILFGFIAKNHRDHPWTIMKPTHASIPTHPHLVASTIDDVNAEDIDLIQDTERIEIRFKQRKQ